MIPAPSARFSVEEAKGLTARPVALFTIFPREHPVGIGNGGTFQNIFKAGPDRLQALYDGFAEGYWISPVLAAGLGRYPSPAQFSSAANVPGYNLALYWRSTQTEAKLAAASWVPLTSGDTVNLYAFYQWKMVLTGYRGWAQAPGDPLDDFTAWAVPAPGDPYASYASPTAVPHSHDSRAYVLGILFDGEFPIPRADVEDAGALSQEVSLDFALTAGQHTLLLNNRHGRYSPKSAAFIFAGVRDWYRRNLRIELGYEIPGTRREVDAFLLYEGQIGKWGPVPSESDPGGKLSPHTAAIESLDFLAQMFEHQIGLSDAAGNPQPLFFGEYLAEASRVVGKALLPPLKTAKFERADLNELDQNGTGNGGTLSLSSEDSPEGTYHLRAQVSAASAFAWGSLQFAAGQEEIFFRGKLNFAALPAAPVSDNLTFIRLENTNGGLIARFYVTAAGKIAMITGGGVSEESDFDLAAYEGVDLDIACWVKCINTYGKVGLWINGDEVINKTDLSLAQSALRAKVGLMLGAFAETFDLRIDDLALGNKYHDQAYQVQGYPFTEIKQVYVEERLKRDNLETLPEYGAVNFTDPAAEVSEDVKIRVCKNDITHPVDIIAALAAEVGQADRVDAAAAAAAKSALPNDVIGCKFENITVAEAINEICKRCLIFAYMEQGLLKLIAYTGAPPGAAALSLGRSELRALLPEVDMTGQKNRISVPYGRHEHNPRLSGFAEDLSLPSLPQPVPEENPMDWKEPVATELKAMAQEKAERLLTFKKFPPEIWEARGSLRLARLELVKDAVELFDPLLMAAPATCRVFRKEISLGPPFGVALQPTAFPGEED